MLKKEFRLSKRKDIAEVKDKGKLLHSPDMGLLVLKKEGQSKFGWIVSKKVSKKAVDRNRIKRLLAMSVAAHWNEVENRGYRGVFLARSNMVGKKLAEIEREVAAIFKSIK